MKEILLAIAISITFIFCGSAQERSNIVKSQSKTVELLEKEGTLLKKEFEDLGNVSGVSFEYLKITDLTNNIHTNALVLRTTYYTSSYAGDTSYSGYLDFDEIAGCLKSLVYMRDNILNTTPSDNVDTECCFISRDGVRLITFFIQGQWMISIQTDRYSNNSTKRMPASRINDIIDILKETLDKTR